MCVQCREGGRGVCSERREGGVWYGDVSNVKGVGSIDINSGRFSLTAALGHLCGHVSHK